MHSSCRKLTLYMWICSLNVRVRSSGERTRHCELFPTAVDRWHLSTRGGLPRGRGKHYALENTRLTQSTGRQSNLIFSNEAEKAVLFIGNSRSEINSLAERQKIP